eukprot:1156671-Pelagomonas_calceolata.AAC.10
MCSFYIYHSACIYHCWHLPHCWLAFTTLPTSNLWFATLLALVNALWLSSPFRALGAVWSAWLMSQGSRNLPLSWLSSTPFIIVSFESVWGWRISLAYNAKKSIIYHSAGSYRRHMVSISFEIVWGCLVGLALNAKESATTARLLLMGTSISNLLREYFWVWGGPAPSNNLNQAVDKTCLPHHHVQKTSLTHHLAQKTGSMALHIGKKNCGSPSPIRLNTEDSAPQGSHLTLTTGAPQKGAGAAEVMLSGRFQRFPMSCPHAHRYVVEVPSTGTVLDVLVALARTANLPVTYPPSSTKAGAKAGVAPGQEAAAAAAAGGAMAEAAVVGGATAEAAVGGGATAGAAVGGGATAEAASAEEASAPQGTANQPESSGLACQGLPRVEGVLSCAK